MMFPTHPIQPLRKISKLCQCCPLSYQDTPWCSDALLILWHPSRLCLQLNKTPYESLHSSRRETQDMASDSIACPQRKSCEPTVKSLLQQSTMNFRGNSAESKLVKQDSVVSSQISSVCLYLAGCQTNRTVLFYCI